MHRNDPLKIVQLSIDPKYIHKIFEPPPPPSKKFGGGEVSKNIGIQNYEPKKGQANLYTRVIFYVRREVDLMKTAKVNACIMDIFGKIELLSIHAT